jgi:hypothetical protein
MFPWVRATQIAVATCVFSASVGDLRAQEGEPPEPPPEAEPAELDIEEEVTETTPAGLVEARAAIGEAQFAAALQGLDKALRSGQAQPQHLQEIYRLQGETLVAVGKSSEAKDAFKILLVLNSAATLGEFASPKIVSVLDEARSELEGGALQGRHQFDSKARRLDVVVESDPLAMTAKVRLSYPREDGSAARLSIPLEEGKAIFDVPGKVSAGVELALLDRNGNVIQTWQVEELPKAAAAIPKEPLVVSTTSSVDQPLWAKWWVYAGAGAAFATVGTVFGITASSAQSDLDDVIDNPGEHFFSDAKRLEDKAQSRATLANVSFVMAGAFGVASGVMYWRGRDSESSLQVAPATDGTSASLLLGGRF